MTEFTTARGSRGPRARSGYGASSPRSTRPPRTSTAPAIRRGYNYSRALADPTPHALENTLGELEGQPRDRVRLRHRRDTHTLTAVCSAATTTVVPDGRTAAPTRLVDKILARFSVAYDIVDQTDVEALRTP